MILKGFVKGNELDMDEQSATLFETVPAATEAMMKINDDGDVTGYRAMVSPLDGATWNHVQTVLYVVAVFQVDP